MNEITIKTDKTGVLVLAAALGFLEDDLKEDVNSKDERFIGIASSMMQSYLDDFLEQLKAQI